jgi:hypothetical protein
MDDFLTKMYEDEIEKTAGAELDEFMASLPKDELEAFLIKEAVGGSAEAPLPDAAQGKEMDAKQQAARKQVDKEHNTNPAPRHEETRTTSQVTKEAAAIADKAGRVLAKWASACKAKMSQGDDPEAAPIGDQKSGEEKKEPGKLKQSQGDEEGMEVTAGVRTEAAKKLIGRVGEAFKGGRRFAGAKTKPSKTSLGGGGPVAGDTVVSPKAIRSLNEMARRAETKGMGKLERAGFHVGEHGKKYLAGAGALTAAEVARRALKSDKGKEKGAEAKAEIAERSMRLTRGAPEHIKLAAAALAGRQIAGVDHPFDMTKDK